VNIFCVLLELVAGQNCPQVGMEILVVHKTVEIVSINFVSSAHTLSGVPKVFIQNLIHKFRFLNLWHLVPNIPDTVVFDMVQQSLVADKHTIDVKDE
jgi:hypothetical protein